MNVLSSEQVDVGALFAAKNPCLARRIPRPAMRLLELIVHQRELRSFVRTTEGQGGCDFAARALEYLDIRIETVGEELIPIEGRFVFCANHPTGGPDGLALIHLLCRRYGTLRLPVNDLLLALPGLRDLVAPVDKFGGNGSRMAAYEAMYAGDAPVLVFPAGRTARFRGGALREYDWDKAFIKQARRHGRTVIPVHISGRNSRHFYGIWRLRRALGIRMNFEMLLLVDELLRHRGATVRVRFGAPVDLGLPRGPREDVRLAQCLRRRVQAGLDQEEPGEQSIRPRRNTRRLTWKV